MVLLVQLIFLYEKSLVTLQNFAKYITHSVCLFISLFVTLPNFCTVYYLFCLLVCKFVCLQHNSKTTERIGLKFLGSIKTVTRVHSDLGITPKLLNGLV